MMLRTKSRIWQWVAWLCAALVFLVVYVVLSQRLVGAVGWNPFDYRYHRLMLPLVVLFVLVARETRWDGIVRVPETKARGECEGRKAEEGVGDRCRRIPDTALSRPQPPAPTSTPAPSAVSSPPPSPPPGAELFDQARALSHHRIPDFQHDDKYLDLLGQSAAAGYAPALAKLGEYAMRRAAWVEAYYWMTQARRNGMHGLSPTLREIRKNWAMVGFPDERSNVNKIFTREAGSLGRALLHLDSGQSAAVAREFLKAHHPEFLSED